MPPGILNGVLGCLNGACPNDFSRWFCFKYGRLFRKGIDPLTFLGRGLFDDDELRKAREQESAALLQFLVANANERFEDAFDVLLAQSVMFGGDSFNLLRFRHHRNGLLWLPRYWRILAWKCSNPHRSKQVFFKPGWSTPARHSA